ncbi:MAG: MarR family transcriptional regulator [Pseudomonadota bacterium]
MSDPYELAYEIDRLMRRIAAGTHAKAPEFDPERVGPLGGMVLLAIADAGTISIQALATQMSRDKAQMTRLIQSLEAKSLLHREISDEDARINLLELTPKGEALVVAIKHAVSEVLDEILTPLTRADRESLFEMLQRL